jgi:carbon storage regulator CsrA
MLVLSRRINEKILLPSIHASVEVLDIKGDRVRLGIEAPASVTILREELAGRQSGAVPAGAPPLAAKQPSAATIEAIEELARKSRHQFRNHLNSATIGIALVQRQMQAGQFAQAESTLAKITTGVNKMTEQLDEVILPGAGATHVSGPAAAAPAAVKNAPKALLVEDDHNECELLAGFFRLAGYQVATASDGADALDYLHEHECPDVMLLDMVLPRCDGPTTIRRLRDEPAFNDLKIYAISGLTPDQVGFDYRASGVARWFQKPLNPELLLRELNATRLASVAV